MGSFNRDTVKMPYKIPQGAAPRPADPFAGLMGGIKTCKKIMNNEFEYVAPQKNRWPSTEKEIVRNENKKVELTRYKRVKKYDDFVFKTSGYEVDHVCGAVKSNVLGYLTELENGTEKKSQFDKIIDDLDTIDNEESLNSLDKVQSQLRLIE